jgi:hypothetical protein
MFNRGHLADRYFCGLAEARAAALSHLGTHQ